MITFGIMQGRLSPAPQGRPQAFPWQTWAHEFSDARAAGFDHIEWLVTAERANDNPLLTDAGIADIRDLVATTGVGVASICADCFIPLPLVRVPVAEQRQRTELLTRIVRQAARLDARVVVLPLLEANAPADLKQGEEVLRVIEPALRLADALGVRIALETSSAGAVVRNLIATSESPSLGVCYDIGNAAAFGLDVSDDLRALGSLVIAVHVKDRSRDGESRPLGEGDADLDGAFRALDVIGYDGPAILETPVGDHALRSASRNLAVARRRTIRMAVS